MNKYLSYSLSIVTFVIGIGFGYTLTPEYSTDISMKNTGMVALGRADKFVDQRYINNMIAHHLNAIDMMNQALKNTKRSEIKDLASTIIKLDEASIIKLYQLKRDWYKDTRSITIYEKTNLGDSDDSFDLRLLNALIAHHDEAIVSSKELRSKSSKTETLIIANDTIELLTSNKEQLLKWRQAWYNI